MEWVRAARSSNIGVEEVHLPQVQWSAGQSRGEGTSSVQH